jgi:hypothetical protein
MKTITTILTVIVLLPLFAFSKEWIISPEVIVESVALSTSSVDLTKTFDLVFNKDEFAKLTTDNWVVERIELISSLIKKAEQKQLNHESLKKCLNKANTPTDRAILPIAAFYTKKEDKETWTICCVWEYPNLKNADGSIRNSKFGHILTYLFDAKTCDQIDMATCR